MEVPGSGRRVFDIGDFRVDPAQRRLFDRDGRAVALPSRAFEVLLYLVQHPGDLIDKTSLMNAVWPDSVVEDGNLTQCIFTLRRVLGEAPGEHRYIVTVPGRGYQFAAPVRVIDEATAPTSPRRGKPWSGWRYAPHAMAAIALVSLGSWWWRSRDWHTAATPRSLAVMPFADLSPARDMEFLADGMADEITSSLARASGLRVTARRSAFSFKGSRDDPRTIGRKLNVDVLVEGSVRKDGQRLRVSAWLVRTEDGVSFWTRDYDRRLADVPGLQDSIARDVGNELRLGLTHSSESDESLGDARPTRNPDAYTAYLRGIYFFNKATAAAAARASMEFTKAVELDPDFAMAHAWRARAFESLTRSATGDLARNRQLASSSIDRATKLDPTIADLWWVRSRLVEGPGTPLSIRAAAVERALALNPNDADAMVRLGDLYSQAGRREDSFAIFERAHQVDPLWTQADLWLALAAYSFKSDSRRAEKLADEMIAIAPDNSRGPLLHDWVAMNEGRALDWDRWNAAAIAAAPRDASIHSYAARDYGDLGELDAALYHARIERELAPENAVGWQDAAIVMMRSGKLAEARKLVRDAMAKMPADFQALVALAELQYFDDDCAGSIRTMKVARPGLGQPKEAIAILSELNHIGTFAWCLRRSGEASRAADIRQVLETALGPPTAPGLYDGLHARMAAAMGDREGLLKHLSALANSPAVQFEFSIHEPMAQPWMRDPAIKALLDKIEARRTAWRRIIPKSSMRVPIPAAPVPSAAAN